MSVSGTSVGIDYHQHVLQVSVMSEKGEVLGSKRLANEVEGVCSYVSSFGAVNSVAVEACTGSSNFIDELREESGWRVKLCHPGYVQRMRHNPDKSDKSDSYLLSDLNRVGYLPEVWLAPEKLRDLRQLVRYRKQLVELRKEVKLRIRAILRLNRIKKPLKYKSWWTKQVLKWLWELKELPEHTEWILKKHLREHERLSEEISEAGARIEKAIKGDLIVEHLRSMKGIGSYTAALIRAEIGVFSRFKTGKQLSRFCGVTPRNCSSGERQADSGLIKAGNPSLKTAIIEACHLLVRYNKKWNRFAKSLLERGKPYCVAIGAVANRFVRWLHHEMVQVEQAAICKSAA